MGEQVNFSISEAISRNLEGNTLSYFAKKEFNALFSLPLDKFALAKIFSDMCRFNCLYMISRAGSGHIGSSFSSMDIISWLYLNILKEDDIYFSSKGHDAPGLYAVQAGLGILPFNKIHKLRRLGGLPGHPDVNTPGSFTNTGSLGMGVSKAKGFLFASNFHSQHNKNIYVLTGDGELQEGQFWESLMAFSSSKTNRITIIIDSNKIQSDTYVEKVSSLGNLEAKLRAFNCRTININGHDFQEIQNAFDQRYESNTPLVIIANTIKGKGISFMEHENMSPDQEYYKYHSGAPTLDELLRGNKELIDRLNDVFKLHNLPLLNLSSKGIDSVKKQLSVEKMIPAYSEKLRELIGIDKSIVALDADLVLDTGLIPIKKEFPANFIECGIAEQDMVSQAGTMAMAGLTPIVHSFSCFLTSRPAEQIYNNTTQGGKIVYVGSLSGILPGGPGHSHQATRDITLMSGLPDMSLLEPFNIQSVARLLDWSISFNQKSSYIRLTSIPYETSEELENAEISIEGQGIKLNDGKDITLITYGPIFSYIGLKVRDLLEKKNISLNLIAMPWINILDPGWFKLAISNTPMVVTLENHNINNGAGSHFINLALENSLISNQRVTRMGIDSIPACGNNYEVLEFHNLTAEQISKRLEKIFWDLN